MVERRQLITAGDVTGDGLAEINAFNPHPMQHLGFGNSALSVAWSLYQRPRRRSETTFGQACHSGIGSGRRQRSHWLITGQIRYASARCHLGYPTMPPQVDNVDDIPDIDAVSFSSIDPKCVSPSTLSAVATMSMP